MKKSKKIILTICILEALIILCAFIYQLMESKNKSVIELDPSSYTFAQNEEGSLVMLNNVNTIDSNYSGTDRRLISPTIELNSGIYQTDVIFQSSTPCTSTVGTHISASSQDAEWISSESVMLTNKSQHIGFRFYIKKGNTPVDVRAIMDDNISDTVTISQITITPLNKKTIVSTIIRLFVLFLFIDTCIFFFFSHSYGIYQLSKQQRCVLLGLFGLLFMIELPMTMNYIPKGYDLRFHYYRIYSIATGLQDGIFPVKIQPEWLAGYGYATGVFYGDVFLYFPAILYVLGFSLSSAYKTYVLFINILTILNSYYCFRKISRSPYLGLAGTAIYTMSLHRLVATYTRAAVGAFSGMAFLPFVILGLWNMFSCGDEAEDAKADNSKASWIFLGIGITGLLQTHILGTIMTCLFIIIFLIINFKKTFCPKVLLCLGKTALFTLCLNLSFIVPFLDLYIATPLQIQTEYRPIYQYSAYISQLFTNTFNAVGDVREDLTGMYHDMPMSLGPAALVLLLFCLGFILIYNTGKSKGLLSKPLFCCLSAIYIATNLFPYKWLEAYCPFLFYFFMKFEFAWRFLAIAAALLPLLFILLYHAFMKQLPQQKKWINSISVLLILCFVWQGSEYIFQYNDSMIPFEHENDFRDLSIGAVYNGQYLFDGFNTADISPEITISNPDQTTFEVVEAKHLDYSIRIDNASSQEGYLELPLIPYKGYHASFDKGELNITTGENQRMCILIPAGFSNTIHIYYSEPVLWRISEIISLLTLCLFIAYMLYKKYFKKGFSSHAV